MLYIENKGDRTWESKERVPHRGPEEKKFGRSAGCQMGLHLEKEITTFPWYVRVNRDVSRH